MPQSKITVYTFQDSANHAQIIAQQEFNGQVIQGHIDISNSVPPAFFLAPNQTNPSNPFSAPNVTANTSDDGTGNCSTTVAYAPTASDNCSGSVSVVCSPPSGSVFSTGVTTVTATATDTAGNTATKTFTVTVSDNEAPAANAASLPDVIAQCSANLPAAPTATDACEGPITGVADVSGPFGQGEHTITWTYTDSHNNR